PDMRCSLYQVSCGAGDSATMQQHLDWARGKPDEYVALNWQTQTAAFLGQRRRSQDFSRNGVDMATRSDAKEVAAQYAVEAALRDAVFGQCSQTKAAISQAAGLARNQLFLTRGALALALCGDAGQVQSLVEEVTKERPKDTLINSLWVPTIRAAVQINRNNPAEAVKLLEAARGY